MSGLSGRLANDNQKSCENSCFKLSFKLSELANLTKILNKFKPPNQVA